MGLLVAIPLYSTSPKVYKFMQSTIAVEMWREGASGKLYRFFNFLGMCQGADAARAHVDVICAGHDNAIKLWKRRIEVISIAQLCNTLGSGIRL